MIIKAVLIFIYFDRFFLLVKFCALPLQIPLHRFLHYFYTNLIPSYGSVAFNIIISYIFLQNFIKFLKLQVHKLRWFSSSILTIFIIFSIFLTIPSYKELMTSAYHQRQQHFLPSAYFNRFFNNCIKLYWWNIKGRRWFKLTPSPPQKTTFKRHSLE